MLHHTHHVHEGPAITPFKILLNLAPLRNFTKYGDIFYSHLFLTVTVQGFRGREEGDRGIGERYVSV